MRIRSQYELSEYLSGSLSRRKREVTTIKFLVSRARTHEVEPLLRAAICLLYAHWEGFVREAATAYLSYVSRQGTEVR